MSTTDHFSLLLEHLKTVVDHLPSAVYVCEAPTGVIRLYNARAAELWGRSPKVGDTDERFCGSFRLFRPDGRFLAHADTPMAEALRGGGLRDEDVVIERPDGSRVQVHVTIAPLRAANGTIAGAINVFRDITERKRLEDALRLSEARYRAVVEDNPDLVCRFMANGTLTFVNDAYCRYFGLDRARVLGTRYSPLLHPDDVATVEAAVAALSASNRVAVIENRVTRADGAVRWTEWTNHAIYDDQGRLLEFESAGRDVTDRKQAEADAARLAAIVTSADDAIMSNTLDGIVVSWNRAAERMLGYAETEMVGKPIATILPPERSHEETEILEQLERGEAVKHLDTERVARDGRRVAVSLTVSAVKTADGRIIGVSTIARDVSAERQALDALRRSERELSDFFDNAVVPLHWVSPNGTIIRANKAELAMLGYAAEEYVGRPIAAFHADQPVIDDILRCLTSGDTIQNRPARLRHKDGSIREVLISSNVLRENGRFVHTRCITLDVTDVRHLEREREHLLARERQARAQAEAANQAKDEFLAMLAHELRNPLSVIANAVTVLNDAADAGPRAAHTVVVIRRQTEHLARLLDDLLDVARITSGRIELEREHFDLRRAVELAVEAQRHRIDAKRQRLTMSIPGEALTMFGDFVRVQQVIGNLLNNASKYTPVEGAIAVSLEGGGGEAVLKVADTGAGIPSDKLDAIFDLFVQANPSLARTEGGLGIGLTLVKRVVELHGGGVVAHSDGLGQGAEIVVRLPVASPLNEAPARRAAPAHAPARRVLVIEDNDDGREMLVMLLELSGHHVLQAATGREGLDIAATARPEIVLVDLGLPDVHGHELGSRLRELLGEDTVIAAVSGYGQPADRARSKSLGFDAHLVKPVEPDRLAAVLRIRSDPTPHAAR